MIRDFVMGVLWGGAVAGLGLGVVSQIAPLPGKPGLMAEAPVAGPQGGDPQAADPAPETAGTVAEPAAPEAAATGPEAAEAASAEAGDAAPAESAGAAPAAPEGTDDVAPAAETAAPAPEPASPEGGADQPAAAPAEVEAPAPAGQMAEAPAAPAAESPANPPADPAPQPAEASGEAAPAPQGQTPAAEDPPAVVAGLPQPGAEGAEEPLLDPAAVAPPAPAEPAEPASTLAPDGGLADSAPGVTVGRLPSIATPEAPAPADAPAVSPADNPDLPPLQRHARPFAGAGGKPLYAILLVDDGAPDLDRAALAALPFPVTFVLDPFVPGAAEAMALYRAAGQEVAIFGTGIPKGATAADVEQTFEAHAGALPETVAVVDPGAGGFQNNRALSAALVDILKSQGRGLITFDQGLNAADQVARREALPAATIFRTLDDEGEDTPLIRRYLDRAAFKAAQEGQVIVMGSTRPETIAALLEWSVEGRAASVALAPASALLGVN